MNNPVFKLPNTHTLKSSIYQFIIPRKKYGSVKLILYVITTLCDIIIRIPTSVKPWDLKAYTDTAIQPTST